MKNDQNQTTLSAAWMHNFITQALAEDVGDGDHTSLACIAKNQSSKAKLLAKDVGIIAGVDFARQVLEYVDPEATMEVLRADGEDVLEGDIVFLAEGNTQALLKAERLILNAMQRMSGIATMARRFADEVEGYPVTLLDTRKTTPLLRPLEKWAVRLGGCTNYRSGLYDWIMIKDNHIKACGGITPAIRKVQKYLDKHQLKLGITIEVKNLVETHEVLATGGVTRIMFDNFELPLLYEAVSTVNRSIQTEVSGGVNLQTVRAIAATGVDYISIGALTHSAGVLDLSLKII